MTASSVASSGGGHEGGIRVPEPVVVVVNVVDPTQIQVHGVFGVGVPVVGDGALKGAGGHIFCG
jgi:hypothetical protein